MDQRPQTRQHKPSFVVLLAINITLCLASAAILDLSVSVGNTTLIWLAAGLLAVLLALFSWSIWQARKTGLTFPVAESSPTPLQTVWPALVFLLLLAAGLRLYHLGTHSLWFDEVWTIRTSTRPLSAILTDINSLTYVVTRLLLQLNRSEFVLRLGSAFAGILTVPVAFHLGRTLYGRREGLMTAFLFSVSYYAIWHSQELRFYAWQMLFSTLSFTFLLRGLRHNHPRDWVGFAISTALNLYTHPLTLMLLASEGLYVAFALTRDLARCPAWAAAPWKARLQAWTRRAALPAASAAAALVAYLLPQLPGLLRYLNPHWFTGIESGLPQPLHVYATTWLIDPIVYGVYSIFGFFSGGKSFPVFMYILLCLLLVGLIASRPKIIVLTLIIVLLPPVVILALEMRIFARYFSYFVPIFLALLAHAIIYLGSLGRKKWQQYALTAVLASLFIIPNLAMLSPYYSKPAKTQWREAAALIDTEFQPGDQILINSFYPLTVLPLDWYATTPEKDLPRNYFPEGGVLSDMGQLDDLSEYTRGYERTWFLFANQEPELEAPMVRVMKDTHRQVVDWSFLDLHLILFEAENATGDQ